MTTMKQMTLPKVLDFFHMEPEAKGLATPMAKEGGQPPSNGQRGGGYGYGCSNGYNCQLLAIAVNAIDLGSYWF
jgi:hypothetical protein